VNYLLGISGVDPMRYGLLMERFCSPLRAQLPDIDIDVESARRTEIYEKVLARFSGERVTCVSMMDTYRVRHAIRDVGAALGMPPSEVDAMAKAFPHISARNVRHAIADLPELRASGLNAPRLDLMLDLVERLDGLPRHIALHPCGVVLSNSRLLDRTPVEASWLGFPMSQFDKDDVETLGLLKLDILGIRMQSAMAHAVDEVRRVDGVTIDLDNRQQVPLDDETTFRMVRTTHTLGCFQIESPGQRELIGKFGPETFEDLITDISLFRPGPVKSDMIVPFLNARHGWKAPEFLHPTLIPALQETEGVVVFHEQVLLIVAETTGVTLAEADEVRRAMGSPTGQKAVEAWWRPAARARGYPRDVTDKIWEVLKAFASFGFCKAHAAAFALPTYQSAWLKAHHPAAFLSGVLTHDPGMYPKRLILDDARSLGIAVLGLDVNDSKHVYVVERLDSPTPLEMGDIAREPDRDHPSPRPYPLSDLPDGSGYGIRISLADVKGISGAEVARLVAGQPYFSLADFWNRAHVSRPVVERLVLAGGFDSVYAIDAVGALGAVAGGRGEGRLGRPAHRGPRAARAPQLEDQSRDQSRVQSRVQSSDRAGDRADVPLDGPLTTLTSAGLGRRGQITRRDLLLHVAELDRWSRAAAAKGQRGQRGQRGLRGGGSAARSSPPRASGARSPWSGQPLGQVNPGDGPGAASSPGNGVARVATPTDVLSGERVAALARSQSQAARAVVPAEHQPIQLTLDLGDTPRLERGTGLPEMTGPERVRAELDILGLDASAHIVDFYGPMLDALGVTRSTDILGARNRSEVLIAGVKVATQTPPVRSGRRVVFLTLDDATGPVDATFFEDAQGPYATTVFHSWMLLVRGITRRTGPRGISVRATGAWELSGLWDAWTRGGLPAVLRAIEEEDRDAVARNENALAAAAEADGRIYPLRPRVSSGGGGREVGGDRVADERVTDDREGNGAPPRRPDWVAQGPDGEEYTDGAARNTRAGGMGGGSLPPGTRRVLVHASGFTQSPYADVRPAGGDTRAARGLASGGVVPDAFEHAQPPAQTYGGLPHTHPHTSPHALPDDPDAPPDTDGVAELGTPLRKLWHASPGSSGR
ncbi:MAG: hypothetical protein M3Y26_04005, partial [Actinomycetota bacterium]|nr:hypothetical protein [Actinomycetota bacterium]